MFMLSLIFVIVYGLFEWKRVCAGFFSSFIYMYCCWRSSYQGRRVGIPFSSLNQPHFCSWPKPGPVFPMPYDYVLLFFVFS